MRKSKPERVSHSPGRSRGWRGYAHGLIGREISRISRYCDRVVQLRPLEHDTGQLLDAIDCAAKSVETGELSDLRKHDDVTLVLLNGTLNHDLDIQALLTKLKSKLNRRSRVVVVAYNPYLRSLFQWASRLGLRRGPSPSTFVTKTDLENLAELSGFEVTRYRAAGFVPFRAQGIGHMINAALPAVPLLRQLALTNVVVLRPIVAENRKPSLSVVIPARDERGNIEDALKRLSDWKGGELEIIFVEGHSSDGTWDEIQRVIPLYADRFRLQAFQQTGKGKADAVRLGFSHATGDLLTILDADLTMPPELLHRFYDAYCEGVADFINGSRLVYPMEGDAMRFLNRLGNTFFAKALSAVLGMRIGDSLCGTKLLRREDYDRIIAWRKDFGDFDPFGDFELLFPAASLALGVKDIPIRYRARTYGSTSISRFRHGLMLLRMTAIGLFKVSASLDD